MAILNLSAFGYVFDSGSKAPNTIKNKDSRNLNKYR